MRHAKDILIFSDSNGALGFGRYAGAYRVASELRDNGFSVQVVDFFADYTLNELKNIIDMYLDTRSLWVGFSTTLFAPGLNAHLIKQKILSGEYNNSFMIENWKSDIYPQEDSFLQEFVDYLRKTKPQVKIVVGGTKATRHSPFNVDYYIWGEADTSSVELSKYLSGKTQSIKCDDFFSGKRIIGDHYPVTQFQTKTIEWSHEDHIFKGEHLPIELSRGCAFRCTYCSFKNLGRRDNSYLKKIDTFEYEVKRNFDLFETTGYMFSDDTFNDSLEKVKNYADCIQKLDFKLTWAGYCRVDMFEKYPEMLPYLKQTNPAFINFGIETFDHKAGKAVGKGLDPEKVKDLLYQAKEVLGKSVILSCNFIVGLRYEAEKSIWKTIEWLQREDCPVDAFNFTPLYVIHYRRDVFDKTSDFSNSIGNNPEKFGYFYNKETGYWSHETMDSSTAHKIVNQIYQLEETQKKTLANRIGFYGRLKNLGFEMSDLLTGGRQTSDQLVLRLVDGRLKLKETYFNRLMNKL